MDLQSTIHRVVVHFAGRDTPTTLGWLEIVLGCNWMAHFLDGVCIISCTGVGRTAVRIAS